MWRDKYLNEVVCGHALELLPEIPDGVIHCVVTSPPYWGLRDYKAPAQIWGGEPGCEHAWGAELPKGGRIKREVDADPKYAKGLANPFSTDTTSNFCSRCGAWRGQLGLEPTIDLFEQHIVEICREVKRVLRDDGVMFLNLGDSYSSKTPNVADCLNGLIKCADVIFFDTESIAITAEGIDIAPDNKRSPDFILPPFFCAEGMGIQNGDNDFGEVLDFFATPTNGRVCGSVFSAVATNPATPETAMDIFDCSSVVFSELDADAKAKLAILRVASTRTRENYDTAFAVEETSKPRKEIGIRWHTIGDAVAFATAAERFPNIDFINQPVAFRNGTLPFACLCRDFRITKAGENEVSLTSVKGGFVFTVSDVRHLRFSFGDGCVIPYAVLYEKASRMSRRNQAKQEVGIPERVKIVLQEDGWICRKTIIWHKPNPMPESCRDRPTTAHEHVFLLTKSARYFYDQDAIREKAEGKSGPYFGSKKQNGTNRHDIGRECQTEWSGRNARSVWTIATKPYPEAHFATFPPELARRCIVAGSPTKVCAECGAGWERVVEKGLTAHDGKTEGQYPEGTTAKRLALLRQSARERGGEYQNETKTLGFRPTCDCNGKTDKAIILDPFAGAGTTLKVAHEHFRHFIGLEINPDYIPLAEKRGLKQGVIF